jgi:hypothetical protein
MRQRLRSHLTYANVMVTILAFIVLTGGTAVALSGANTVFTDDIADDTVPAGGGNPAGGLIAADLRPNSVGTSEAVDNSLTGTDVNEGTLNLAAGAWRQVGAAGQPPFNNSGFCSWGNFGAGHNTAAFLRDRFGFVHLRGLVDADDISTGCDFTENVDKPIFNLPAGYRPAAREALATITNGALGRVNVDGPAYFLALGDGAVSVDAPTTEANAKQWISLDGISFRCAPSGSNGCP